MTNEKLGVLLVDVPEPTYWKYTYITKRAADFVCWSSDSNVFVQKEAYHCTQEEAEKYPQFRWVALEELE
ncbi:hypothetical protein EJA00_12145 [Streptococcus suis]|uniref:Uncharacterized protein n=1 Tax=Streptococcus suis TaxID=1307 RepID=A0A3R8R0L4_STRSU|nr:hypothetical protein [Streptococcus suis]RRR39893.1 hypothetical protein EJA00_12145 [Streptococcus suis]